MRFVSPLITMALLASLAIAALAGGSAHAEDLRGSNEHSYPQEDEEVPLTSDTASGTDASGSPGVDPEETLPEEEGDGMPKTGVNELTGGADTAMILDLGVIMVFILAFRLAGVDRWMSRKTRWLSRLLSGRSGDPEDDGDDRDDRHYEDEDPYGHDGDTYDHDGDTYDYDGRYDHSRSRTRSAREADELAFGRLDGETEIDVF